MSRGDWIPITTDASTGGTLHETRDVRVRVEDAQRFITEIIESLIIPYFAAIPVAERGAIMLKLRTQILEGI
jgi:hypothetical protein